MRVSWLAIVLAGCVIPGARPPATGARATGEPLAIVTDSEVMVSSHQVKTDYLLLGAYDEKLEIRSHPVWYVLQGDSRISDEDFFTIAGNPGALAATRRMHAAARKWNHRGKLVMLGGAVAIVGGYFVPNTLARALSISVGLAGVSGGFVLAFWSDRQVAPEHHAVDRSLAEQAARLYNVRLERRF